MIRDRRALLVTDARSEPRAFRALSLTAKMTSYVAAPIVSGESVIGYFQADRYFSDEGVDTLDRDVLWAFSEGFGRAARYATLVDRLHNDLVQLRRLIEAPLRAGLTRRELEVLGQLAEGATNPVSPRRS